MQRENSPKRGFDQGTALNTMTTKHAQTEREREGEKMGGKETQKMMSEENEPGHGEVWFGQV